MSEKQEHSSALSQPVVDACRASTEAGGSGAGQVWLVHGTVGEWSDRSEWVVCACHTEADARGWAEYLGEQTRARRPADSAWSDYDPDGTKWDAYEASMRALDAGFNTYCGEAPTYTAGPAELRAAPPEALTPSEA